VRGRRPAAAALLLAAALAACGRDRTDEPARPPAQAPVLASDTPSAVPSADTMPADGTTLSAVVRRTGERQYTISGQTREARALELSVEDGHNVLYGPAPLEVEGGRFSAGFALEPTDMPTVYAYITEPSGARQWVIPVPLGQAEVRFGPPVPGGAAPADSAGTGG
jgi:hypothetical protein